MLLNLNKLLLCAIFLSLLLFAFLLLPLPVFFSNDEFGNLPLISEGQLIVSSLPRPIANGSVYMDIFIWSMNPVGFYLTNALLHVTNAFLVYFFYTSLIKNRDSNISPKLFGISAAILFLFYSNNSETIFWISARVSSLACLFILLCLIFFIRRKKSVYFLPFSLLAFIGALLTYETSWIIPVAIPLLWFFETSKQSLKSFLLVFASYLAIFILYLIWRQSLAGEIVNGYVGASFLHGNLPNLVKNFARLFTRVFQPPMHSTKNYVVVAVLLSLALFILFLKNRRQILLFVPGNKVLCLLGLCCLSLIPAASIGISTHTSEGERFIYLANAFFAMLFVELLLSTRMKTPFKVAILIVFAGLHFTMLWHNAGNYKSANKMTRQIISEIKNLAPKEFDTIYTINQPDNLNGAVMLRKGFEHAIRWMAPGFKINHLAIISIDQLKEPYDIHFEKMSFAEAQRSLNMPEIPFRTGKDCILLFREEACLFIE
jgi:protein O-mannosyl-transferase